MTVSGDLFTEGAVNVTSGTSFTLAGNFDNQSDDPMNFHWESGPLKMNGSSPQSFELAAQDFGPRNPAGFVNNFAMGTLRIEPGRTVDFLDNFDNSPGTGCEALYVGTLSLGAGVMIRLHGCPVYYRTLTKEPGATVILQNGAALMATNAGDLNGDNAVDINDANQLVGLLLGGACSPGCMAAADLNGDGVTNGADIPLLVRLLVGW